MLSCFPKCKLASCRAKLTIYSTFIFQKGIHESGMNLLSKLLSRKRIKRTSQIVKLFLQSHHIEYNLMYPCCLLGAALHLARTACWASSVLAESGCKSAASSEAHSSFQGLRLLGSALLPPPAVLLLYSVNTKPHRVKHKHRAEWELGHKNYHVVQVCVCWCWLIKIQIVVKKHVCLKTNKKQNIYITGVDFLLTLSTLST